MRRKVYFSVPPAPAFADRDRIATALGIRRNLAAFHLDKLAEGGLLDVSYRRLSGKTGRGAGRPRKLYTKSTREVSVNLPQRNYPLVAALLATAIEAAGRRSREKLESAAYEAGKQLGSSTATGKRPTRTGSRAAVMDTLVDYGYEPFVEGKSIYMRNCPFHGLKRDHRELVCDANTSLMKGLTESIATAGLRAEYQPADDRCCVVLRPAAG